MGVARQVWRVNPFGQTKPCGYDSLTWTRIPTTFSRRQSRKPRASSTASPGHKPRYAPSWLPCDRARLQQRRARPRRPRSTPQRHPPFPSRPQRRSTSFGSASAVALTSFLDGGKTRSPASRGTHLRVRMSGSAALAVNQRLGALIVPARHSCPSTIRSSSVT